MSVSTRMMSYVVLLSTYALAALVVAEDSTRAALFVPPIVLMCLLADRPRWSSPRTIVLAGLGTLVPICLLSVDEWTLVSSPLVVAVFVTAALFGLSLVERAWSDISDDGLRNLDEGVLVPEERVRSIVSRELRRSRRVGTPVALLVLKGMEELDPTERRALAERLRVHGREFDMIFAISADELAILCVNTTRSGAREYIERIQPIARSGDFSIACFPDDAVTLQGLFDVVRASPDGRESRHHATVGQIDIERRNDAKVVS